MQNNYDNRGTCADVTYAGFWVRLAAYAIDSVIVFFMLLVVRLILSGVISALSGTVLGGNILFDYTLKDIVLYLGQVLYFILCTRYTGTTPGKRALNLRVISVDESGELDLLNVVYRETVGRFLSGIFICIGYLIIGVDREKRGFHDMLCDTRVVYGKRVKVYPAYPYPPMQPVGAPPVGTAPGSPENGSGLSSMMHTADRPANTVSVPPVDSPASVRENTEGMSPADTAASGQENRFDKVSPAYPTMPHNGPYRMVQPGISGTGGTSGERETDAQMVEKGDSDNL